MRHHPEHGTCAFCQTANVDLFYHEHADEYWCDNCITNAAEDAWERHCEDFHDGGSTQPWKDK